MARSFKMSKYLTVTTVLALAVFGVALGTASAGGSNGTRATIFWGLKDCTDSPSGKEIGWAQWKGKNGVGVVVGSVTLPAGSYEVSLLHADCGEHTGGTGSTFKTGGGAQKFMLKAPDPDDTTMYVHFVARPGGGTVATSAGIHFKIQP